MWRPFKLLSVRAEKHYLNCISFKANLLFNVILADDLFSYFSPFFLAYLCTVKCFLRFSFVLKTSADNVIFKFFYIFTNELSLFSIQLTLLKQRNSIELKKDLIHWWKCQKFAKSCCRLTVSLRNKMSTDHVIWPIFDIFHQWIESFFNQIDFIYALKLNWLAKRLNLLQ